MSVRISGRGAVCLLANLLLDMFILVKSERESVGCRSVSVAHISREAVRRYAASQALPRSDVARDSRQDRLTRTKLTSEDVLTNLALPTASQKSSLHLKTIKDILLALQKELPALAQRKKTDQSEIRGVPHDPHP